ncbi:MAG: superoxide dismutase [Bacilli bacterium]|nr:superoxide dismutase [Bacilli bacterium]
MRQFTIMGCILMSFLVLSACGDKQPSAKPAVAKVTEAAVNLLNSKGVKIGTVQLIQAADGVHIHLDAANLPPGTHGFHIHETGKCEIPDFKSAGAHLNPQQKQHGFKNPQGFHAGDLPNVEVGSNGKVVADIITKTVTLEKGQPNSLLTPEGTAFIIHEKADDYMTDPSGNSGNRIACGVIK